MPLSSGDPALKFFSVWRGAMRETSSFGAFCRAVRARKPPRSIDGANRRVHACDALIESEARTGWMSKISRFCYFRDNAIDRSRRMNVSLTPELEKIIAERVNSGRYASASEVVREALRLLEEQDQLNQLRHEVRRGLEQIDPGEYRPFDGRAVKRIKRQGREQVAAARQHKSRPR
jgi:antitoxin ParD1/3/4